MVRAVCDKAHETGYIVAAHVESPQGVRVALENGVDSIEHGAILIGIFSIDFSIRFACYQALTVV